MLQFSILRVVSGSRVDPVGALGDNNIILNKNVHYFSKSPGKTNKKIKK